MADHCPGGGDLVAGEQVEDRADHLALGVEAVHAHEQALVAYALARGVGPPLLNRLAGKERMEATDRLIARGGWPILLAGRLIPIVPYHLVSYGARATRVPPGRFPWTTAVARTTAAREKVTADNVTLTRATRPPRRPSNTCILTGRQPCAISSVCRPLTG